MTINRKAACHVPGAPLLPTKVQRSQTLSGQKERTNANFSPTLTDQETPPLSHSLVPIERTFLECHVLFCIHAAGTMFGWWKIQDFNELKNTIKIYVGYHMCVA